MYHYHCFKLVNTITIIFSHPSVHLFPLPDLQLGTASPNPPHHRQRSPSPSSQSGPRQWSTSFAPQLCPQLCPQQAPSSIAALKVTSGPRQWSPPMVPANGLPDLLLEAPARSLVGGGNGCGDGGSIVGGRGGSGAWWWLRRDGAL